MIIKSDRKLLTEYITEKMLILENLLKINKKYIPITPTDRQMQFLMLDCLDAFYGGAAGGGKILSNDGVILTPFGWKKGIDLKVGDLINNPDGSIQRIIQIKQEITLPLWRVRFSDNTFTDVAEDHLWLSWKSRKSRKIKNKKISGINSAEVVETKELLNWIKRGYKPQIPVCQEQPFNRTTKEIDRLDSYLLGVLLGDGCLTQTNITISCNEEDKIFYKNVFGEIDIYYKTKNTIRFKGEKNKYIKNKLRLYGLLGKKSNNKFIPDIFKFSSIDERKELIRGLLDTDGYNRDKRKGCCYYTISEKLANDVAFILRSLGCVVRINKKNSFYKDKNGEKKQCNDCYCLSILARNSDDLFKLKRKKLGFFGRNEISKTISKIEIDGEIKGRCITVSNPNGLYITNDFIVTHNSVALLIAGLLYVHEKKYNAVLLRDTMRNLSMPDSIMDVSHQWLSNSDAKWSGEKNRWTFPSGATLGFGYLDDPKAHFNYQGAQFQYVGIDEAVNIRERQAKYLFSRLRKLKGSNIPIRFRCASNPPSGEQIARGQWVKNRYVDILTRKKGVVFVPAKMQDNPYLDIEQYKESLSQLDVITRKQLEDGNWEIKQIGNIFKREWFKLIDKEQLPTQRKIIRYWDLAATEPTQSNKEPCFTSGAKLSVDENKNIYIESIVRFRKEPKYTEQIIRQTADIDGKNVLIYMEQEPGSSGKNTIDNYRRNILPEFAFYADKVTGSKFQRAVPLSSQSEAGNVFIVKAFWNEDFFNELEIFPEGQFLDQVDSCSGAFNKLWIQNTPRIRVV